MSQPTIKLNDGREIPWLAFGTGTALYTKDAEGAATAAIAAGFIHLDGAQMYQNEDTLGKAIAASDVPRERLFVTTKLHKLAEGETVRESFVGSLKKLRLDYVDLFLIHTPKEHQGRLKDVWRQLEDLKDEGLAKSIGVSNFRVRDFQELGLDEEPKGVRIVPAVNQIEYHPYVYKKSIQLVEYHKKHGIATTSYAGLSPIFRHHEDTFDKKLASISKRLGDDTGKKVTPGQVLGLWLRALGVVEITTTSKKERLTEYLETLTLPDLTSEEVEEISVEGSKTHYRHFMSWIDDEYVTSANL